MNQESELQVVAIERSARWQVYHRLQALEIECYCKTNQTLRVNLDNPLVGIQLWSVVKQVTGARQELIDWLDRCWQIKSYR